LFTAKVKLNHYTKAAICFKHCIDVNLSFIICRVWALIAFRYLSPPNVDCWTTGSNTLGRNSGNDMLIMASAAKSGAVLSARLVIEVRHLFYILLLLIKTSYMLQNNTFNMNEIRLD
jgi:hypothetical protein